MDLRLSDSETIARMTFTESLPLVNATLNSVAALLLTIGFVFIKAKRKRLHRVAMIGAFSVSTVFLFFYVLHKYLVQGVHTEFQGVGLIATVYYTMLATHIVLAILMLPLIVNTFRHALAGHFDVHRRWARITFPIWYYVSVTGVLIYCFLYVWY